MKKKAIKEQDLQRIAALAHLHLTAKELSTFTDELALILNYMTQLSEVDINGVPPTAHVHLPRLQLRADRSTPSLDTKEMLSQAPQTRDQCFVLPGFVDES